MKKILFLALLGMFSCQAKDSYEDNLSKMDEYIKNSLSELAFEINTTIDYMELIGAKYDTISENILDSARMNLYLDTAEGFIKKSKELDAECKELVKNIRLYNSIGWGDLEKTSRDELGDAAAKMKSYADSSKIYIEKASGIENKIKNRDSIDTVYRYNVKIKFTLKDNNSKETYNDIKDMTLYFNTKTLTVIKQ